MTVMTFRRSANPKIPWPAGMGLTAPDLRRYRRKARDRILRIVEVFTFKEGRIDHRKNGRHDRKSHYASHGAYLVQL